MPETIVAAYTIGQTPRPDLTGELGLRFPWARITVAGALDGWSAGELPACEPGGYPLETRMRDGTRVVVDAAFLEPRIQQAILERDAHVTAHVVLCAAPFPSLTAGRPLVVPFTASVARLGRLAVHRLALVVPFRAQAAPAMRKWEASGFPCTAHVLEERPEGRPVSAWLAADPAVVAAEALVFDYVGYPKAILDEVASELDLRVFDLGHLALDALQETLDIP